MSYQVLARKWRPRDFASMVGQEHVLRALINALDNERLHHAYLFTGTRGVGKTTIARILAKCLNCESGITSKPCDQCPSCQEIDVGRFLDLIEVDAASRTKVEDTRELLENVQYAPTRGRYKVYLIDEVHMLSGHSFNALLKTLEEPPEHVKFLLATTDPQKLPVTVLSRCLQFNLKNMLPEQIVEQFKTVLDAEKINYEANALWPLARAANGSMRDGLSLLDQVIAYSNSDVKATEVHTMLGTIEQTHLIQILTALGKEDADTIIQITNQLAEQAADFQQALEDLLSLLHHVSLAQAVPDAIDDNMLDKDQILALAEQIQREDIQLFYQIGLIGRRDLPLAPTPKIGFEMTLLRMLTFQPEKTVKKKPQLKQAQQPPASKPAAAIAELATAKPTTNTAAKPAPSKPAAEPTPTTATQASTPTKPNIKSPSQINWRELVSQLNLNGMSQTIAEHCALESATNDKLSLSLAPSYAPMLSDSLEKQIKTAIGKHFGHEMMIDIHIAKSDTLSPAAMAKAETDKQHQAAQASIEEDPNVRSIIERFDATIAPGSVKPIAEVNDET